MLSKHLLYLGLCHVTKYSSACCVLGQILCIYLLVCNFSIVATCPSIQLPALLLCFVCVVCRCFIWRTKAELRARVGRPQTSSSPPVIFIAGRPKAALLSWFFGDLRCGAFLFMAIYVVYKKVGRKNPQKLTQFSSRSNPRHLVGKRTAQKDTIIDITSDSQVNSNFQYRWSPASLTFNNYFYLFLYLYIT